MSYEVTTGTERPDRNTHAQKRDLKPGLRNIRGRIATLLVAIGRGLVAAKSLILLMVCKEELRVAHSMQFTFATEGKSFYRTLSAFRATTVGNELLQRRPDLGELCCNRAMLQACPTGSLGRRYAEFMISHGLDPESYLRLAIEHSTQFKDAEQIWFHTRIDASHDLRHVLCGYQPDVFGEVCLCWFRYAQAGHCGVFVLASLGFLSLILKRPSLMVFRSTLEAYRRGQRSQLLDLLAWEDQLAQPLAVQRALLGLTLPKHYPTPFAPEAYVASQTVVPDCAELQSTVAGASD